MIDSLYLALVDVSWRAAVLVAVSVTLVHAARIPEGRIRHRVWGATICALWMLPMMAWLPRVDVPVPSWWPGAPAALASPVVVDAPIAVEPESTPATTPATTASLSSQLAVGQRTVTGDVPTPVAASRWPAVVVMVWLAGCLIAGLRCAQGAWRVRALFHSAEVHADDVWLSDRVESPVVAGVWRPRILVPRGWGRWSETTRALVLAHERAHVARHDGAWTALAQGLTVVGWFHPAVWWVERRLTASAEAACDDRVVRAGHPPAAYAALLVGMAAGVGRRGRVMWASSQMARPNGLSVRVDRVLAGVHREPSRWHASVVLIVVVALLAVVVACERRSTPALQPDPEVTAAMEREQARMDEYAATASMTRAEADQLAAHVAAQPDDLAAVRRLLSFYQQRGQALLGWDGLLEARRAVLLTVIERHPESGLSFWMTSRRFDPQGWERAAALWRRHTSAPEAPPQVLANAARFFEPEDLEMSEQLLLRAFTQEPVRWRERLASIYASAIAGAQRGATRTMESVSKVRAESTFARRVRTQLEASNDGQLLALVGASLLGEFAGRDDEAAATLGFSPQAVGAQLVQRGLALDPDQPRPARQLLAYERHWRWGASLADMSPAEWVRGAADVPASMPEDVAAYRIADAADHAWVLDTEADVEPLVARLLAIAGDRPDRVHLRYAATMVQAAVASRRGDRNQAVRLLNDATRLARESSASLEGLVVMARQRVTWTLLDAGELDVVAAYFDAIHSRMSPDSPYGAAADAIRAGRMPQDYQRYRAQEYNRAIAAKR